MSERILIYLDESGDLGFDLSKQRTSRYFIITLLICGDDHAHTTTKRSVKKTLKNKLPKTITELKGSNLSLPVKKYFLKEMNHSESWSLYAAIADKKSWIKNHAGNNTLLKTKEMYDEIACRLFSQLNNISSAYHVDIIVDLSKNKDEIAEFNSKISKEIKKQLSKNAKLTIRHRRSHEELGLQAVDLFCRGIAEKHEKKDTEWYTAFSDRISTEVEYRM